MPLDLSRIGSGRDRPIQPRAVYAALPHRPFPYLRHEQGEVLERWYQDRDDRDVVIKQNTGGGKTVVGLLIAQSSLNEGVSPAVYLAPDTYLATQVRQEADRLGLATTEDPRDGRFRSGDAILVTTLHKLVNGRSVFGVAGGTRDVVQLGAVIVDDAHAALAAAEGQFRIRIPESHELFDALLGIFRSDLEQQSRTTTADILEKDPTAQLRVPYWSWSDKQDRVVAALHPYRDKAPLEWAWPLISHVLHLCEVVITGRSIEIRPPCPPISVIPSFANAKRRVYLTATLADDSVLVTDLDADADLVRSPKTPGSASDLGERLILAPLELNPRLDAQAIRVLARQYADGDRDGDGVAEATPINVVVLVPSDKVAQLWAGFADATHHVDDLERGVADLKAGHVGLVVLVNKYDGVDLPRDACRLLVIDGVPRPLDAFEQRERTALADSNSLRARQVQRVEQGMGRGVRDVEDHCAVLLLGNELSHTLHDPQLRGLFSPATQAQVSLSREVARMIEGEGLDAVRAAIDACLARDPDWVAASRRALADVEYAQVGVVRPEAIAQRRAFDLAAAGQYVQAGDALQSAINQTEDRALRGWLAEQKASYLHAVDPTASQQALAAARLDNGYVLRPLAGTPRSRIQAAAAQGSEAAAYLSGQYADGTALVLGVNALLDEIQWDAAATPAAEAAWLRLGRHLGFVSSRPEKEEGEGPDGLWALSAASHAVAELKTGATTNLIAKRDIDQLGGAVRWHAERYGGSPHPMPLMVHVSNEYDSRATAPSGMRVMRAGELEALKTAMRGFAGQLAQADGRWREPTAVADALTQFGLTASEFLARFTVGAKKAKGTL